MKNTEYLQQSSTSNVKIGAIWITQLISIQKRQFYKKMHITQKCNYLKPNLDLILVKLQVLSQILPSFLRQISIFIKLLLQTGKLLWGKCSSGSLLLWFRLCFVRFPYSTWSGTCLEYEKIHLWIFVNSVRNYVNSYFGKWYQVK